MLIPLCITGLEDFGEPNHSVYTESYYYETAYKDPVPDYNQRLTDKIDALFLKKSFLTKMIMSFATLYPLTKMV